MHFVKFQGKSLTSIQKELIMHSETYREEAKRRGISTGKVWLDRQGKKAVAKTGEDFYLVYAWRWSGDPKHAKIGKSSLSDLEGRLSPCATCHFNDLVLISFVRCESEQSRNALERELLDEILDRIRSDREWVVIDENFNEVFPTDFEYLNNLFDGRIKVEK